MTVDAAKRFLISFLNDNLQHIKIININRFSSYIELVLQIESGYRFNYSIPHYQLGNLLTNQKYYEKVCSEIEHTVYSMEVSIHD